MCGLLHVFSATGIVHPEACLSSQSTASAALVDIQDPPCLVIAALVTLGSWTCSLDWLHRNSSEPRAIDRLVDSTRPSPIIRMCSHPQSLVHSDLRKQLVGRSKMPGGCVSYQGKLTHETIEH